MTAPRERRASPGEARSIVALFLAAGARPDEIDGAVQKLIDMTAKSSLPPVTYEQVAQQAMDAIGEYRRALYPVDHD